MQVHDFIISKQIQWALNQGIQLIGSKDDRGRHAYTPELEQNLFEPLLSEVRTSFESGDGNEVSGSLDSPAKMQAVHSSSALGVNVFQYWLGVHNVPEIAAACGFCDKRNPFSERILFERKFPTKVLANKVPNIDIVIENSPDADFAAFAIECKFTEPYGRTGHNGLKEKYLDQLDVWVEFPSLFQLAQKIAPFDQMFRFLHAAQLIKHVLGLQNAYKAKSKYKLLYLWYDTFGEPGESHRKEVNQFSEIAKSDGVHFISLTYQELILNLAKNHRTNHPDYIHYITERYL